jgi:hypothetical protein
MSDHYQTLECPVSGRISALSDQIKITLSNLKRTLKSCSYCDQVSTCTIRQTLATTLSTAASEVLEELNYHV